MTRRLSLLLAVVLAFGLVSLAAAQQQDQPKAAPNPLVQLLQTKGVLTTQEAAAINQAATPAEQQQRLTQLLYSKGIITQDEFKTTAAAEASRVSDSQGTWLPAAAHVSAGEPEPAMAMPPQKPAAPAVIPAVAPVRVLTSDPPKAGGLVPDIKLGSGAKLKLYGFIKATAAYDSSNPVNIGGVLPGLGGVASGTLPTDITVGGPSFFGSAVPGTGSVDSGPNGSPSFYLKGSATRMGGNFEWPDIAGGNNTITGRIEADFEGNFSRATNRNASSLRTRMLSVRLAYGRIDHKFSDTTTGFILAGYDWAPFGSSIFANLLDTEYGGAFFGSIYTREAQIRLGLWHNFGGSRNFTIGVEPTLGMPAFANLPSDLGVQLGASERQGINSARPEATGRLVFQWQLDKAKGVAPAQIIISGMNAKRVAIVERAAIGRAWCGTTAATDPGGFGLTVGSACAAGITGSLLGSPGGALPANSTTTLLGAFPHGAEASSQRWGADFGIQLPTRYATLVARYYTGADLRWYFGGQNFGAYNDNRIGLLGSNSGAGVPCAVSGGSCPQAFDIDASAPNVFFGFNPATSTWQIIPQRPLRDQGGLAQLSFPLSRIFNANPAGRNAGWVLGFTVGTDQVKARDIRAMAAGGAACVAGAAVPGSTALCPVDTATAAGGALDASGRILLSGGQRNRSDMAIGTLTWKFNQFVTFGYESSVYLTRSTCVGTPPFVASSGAVTGVFPGTQSCTGTIFRGVPARYWHDFRNEFGPIFTF